MLLALFACATVCQTVDGFQLTAKVVGGRYANISDFSYAVELRMNCVRNAHEANFGCGSSILNQYILLTAAHCLRGCGNDSYIIASVGSNRKIGPNLYRVHSYVTHRNYNEEKLTNDVALVKLNNKLKFGPNVGRIILVPNPPYHEKAYVAGWGDISDYPRQRGSLLKSVEQYVTNMSECMKIRAKMVPKGVICASSTDGLEYPAKGDSGSALVVPPNIQLGIASFQHRSPRLTRQTLFYTDVGYHYDWIQTQAQDIFCSDADVV